MALGDAKPHPKTAALARGERRYRRRVAGPKQWAALVDAKLGPCRVCEARGDYSITLTRELHHLVSRGALGDDVADNLAPLCKIHHAQVTTREPRALRDLAESLTDAECAYVVGNLGEGAMQRLFGVEGRP